MIPSNLDKDCSPVIEKCLEVTKKMRCKLMTVSNDIKKREFRKKPELLDEKGLSASQYSLFVSQKSQLSTDVSDEDMEKDWNENLLLID
jgi:hypothetical protein